MDTTTWLAIIKLAGELVGAILPSIVEAIRAGDVSTLEQLRTHLRTAADLERLDAALILAQRAKAAAGLPPTPPLTTSPSDDARGLRPGATPLADAIEEYSHT